MVFEKVVYNQLLEWVSLTAFLEQLLEYCRKTYEVMKDNSDLEKSTPHN